MPLTLNSLLQARATVALKVGEEDFTVTYAPAKLTWETRSQLRDGLPAFVPSEDGKKPAAEVIPPALDLYCALLADVLLAWDVVGEKGKPLPIDIQTLKRFPFDFILSLGREVARDSLVNPQIKAVSASTSPTTGN